MYFTITLFSVAIGHQFHPDQRSFPPLITSLWTSRKQGTCHHQQRPTQLQSVHQSKQKEAEGNGHIHHRIFYSADQSRKWTKGSQKNTHFRCRGTEYWPKSKEKKITQNTYSLNKWTVFYRQHFQMSHFTDDIFKCNILQTAVFMHFLKSNV